VNEYTHALLYARQRVRELDLVDSTPEEYAEWFTLQIDDEWPTVHTSHVVEFARFTAGVFPVTDYATHIAEATPLPPLWRHFPETLGDMSPELLADLAAYGAECARQGYALGYGVSNA